MSGFNQEFKKVYTETQLKLLKKWANEEIERGRLIRLHPTWIKGLAEEVNALTARIAELEGALKKIAKLENKWDAPNDFSNELQKIAQEVLK